MDFSTRITRLPSAFEAERGAETALLIPQAEGDVAKLLAGAGGCSPYLRSLVEKEADWLVSALNDPEAALDKQFTELQNGATTMLSFALRQAKRRVALITGLADLAGVWHFGRALRVSCGAANCRVLWRMIWRAARAWWCWPWARWARKN